MGMKFAVTVACTQAGKRALIAGPDMGILEQIDLLSEIAKTYGPGGTVVMTMYSNRSNRKCKLDVDPERFASGEYKKDVAEAKAARAAKVKAESKAIADAEKKAKQEAEKPKAKTKD